jgi:hypothetical protein
VNVIRNNLLALVVHGAIVAVSFVWLLHIGIGVGSLVAVALYVAAGLAYRDQGSPARNLISLLAPAVFALLTLVLAPFGAPGIGNLGGLLYVIAIGVFAGPISAEMAVTDQNLLAVVLAFGPTLSFWLGLQLKVWRGKTRRHGDEQAAATGEEASEK